MINKLFSATFALALLLTQVAHALPQAGPSDGSLETTPTTQSSPPPNEPEPDLPTPSPLRATFDPTFDNPGGSMDGVACSNGDNGLETQFPTFGDLPSFPFIGGAYDIVWDSPHCGSCWNITNPTTGLSIQMTAIDTSGVGFNLSEEAFANLTNGDTSESVIDVVATKLSTTPCGS